jgi:hypothetical protein
VFSGFLEANNNLSEEILFLKERNNSKSDTIPTKEQLENEKFQWLIRGTAKSNSDLEPLYILKNGKKEKTITSKEFSKLKQTNVKSVNVVKGKSAKKLYGKKGENGVVIVEMKTSKK